MPCPPFPSFFVNNFSLVPLLVLIHRLWKKLYLFRIHLLDEGKGKRGEEEGERMLGRGERLMILFKFK